MVAIITIFFLYTSFWRAVSAQHSGYFSSLTLPPHQWQNISRFFKEVLHRMLSPINEPPKSPPQPKHTHTHTHTHTQTRIDIRTYMHNFLLIFFLPSPQCAPLTNLPIDIICSLEILNFQNGNIFKVVPQLVFNLF